MHTLSRRNAIRLYLLVAAFSLARSTPTLAAELLLAIKGC